MSKKLTLGDLEKRREMLDKKIEVMQRNEQAALAKWVQKQTGCKTLAEVKAKGWVLAQDILPPTQTAEPA